MKADYTGLTGDDIRTLAGSLVSFRVHDVYADQDTSSPFTYGRIAFYGELKQHKPATNLGETVDVFHTGDARKYCTSVVRDISWPTTYDDTNGDVGEAVMSGEPTGGQTTSDSTMSTIYMGNIASTIRTGGDTNPELFVDGIRLGRWYGGDVDYVNQAVYRDGDWDDPVFGAVFPSLLVFVNGSRSAATMFAFGYGDKGHPDTKLPGAIAHEISIGHALHESTGWNLSDAYYVNNWPGTPYTKHKGNGDDAYHFVTQVNYITGYICAASLH
ncbi:hypothetical protein Q2N95_004869 [Salmonella enterica]|nr:hypothetical protein [Salmonella enterica]